MKNLFLIFLLLGVPATSVLAAQDSQVDSPIQAVPSPPPTPLPSPSVSASPSPIVDPSPSPTASPQAPTPTTSPSPVASNRPRGKVIVLDELIAAVNTNILLKSDLDEFRKTIKLRTQLDPLFSGTPLARKGTEASDAEMTEFLVNELVITQQFPATDIEVEQEVTAIQNSNHIDREKLKAALAEQGYSFVDYFELIRKSISKRNLIDREIRPKVTITEDDIKNEFFNHIARSSTVPRAFHLAMISLSIKNYKTPKDAYDQINEILKEIKAGKSFEEIAKERSEHATASAGGELGILTEDQMDPFIRNHLKDLSIGEISKPFEHGSQIYIIKLKDITSSENEFFERQKEEIRAKLATKEFQHQVSIWVDRQRDAAFIHHKGESIIQELGVDKGAPAAK